MTTTADASSGDVTPVGVPERLVSELLTLVGLGASATDAPAVPLQTPMTWAVAAVLRRELGAPRIGESATPTIDTTAQLVDDPTAAEADALAATVTVDTVLDPGDWTVTNPVPLNDLGSDPEGVAVGPDGRIYVASWSGRTVTVIDAASMTPIGQIHVGRATSVALNEDGTRLYVTNWDAGTVEVFDTAAEDLFDAEGAIPVATINVGTNPEGVALSPDGTLLYVTNDLRDQNGQSVPGTVSVIDLTSAEPGVIATIPVGTFPVGLAVSPEGDRIYVVNELDDTLTTIDVVTDYYGEIAYEVQDPISVGNAPQGVAFSPIGDALYITARDANTVTVVDTATNTVVKTIPNVTGAEGIAVSPDGHQIYVSSNSLGLLEITRTNRNPVFAEEQPEPTTNGDDEVVTVTGQLIASDPDDDTLHYTVVTSEPSAKGTVAINIGEDGIFTYTYTPTPQARHAAAADNADQTGADTFTFTVTVDDGHGGQDTYDVAVNIPSVNNDPVFAEEQPEPTINDDDGVVTVTGQLFARDDDDDDSLTYTGTITTDKGTVVIHFDGSYTYTPTPEARHAAAADNADQTGADTFTFTVTVDDGHGGQDTYNVALNIPSINHDPVFAEHEQTTNTTNGVVTGSVTYSDSDVGDTLTYTGSITTDKGTAVVNPNGSYTYTPTPQARHDAAADNPGEAGADTFTITVTDGHGGTATTTVVVTITPANNNPTFEDNRWATDENTGNITGQLTYRDGDIGDTLTYTGSITTDKGTVLVDPNGGYTYTPTPAARHAAAAIGADEGVTTDTFTITVDDGHGGRVLTELTVDILGTNNIPVHDSESDQQGTNNDTGVVTGRLAFFDNDEGDTLTYSGSITTDKGTVVVNPDGSYTYTPTDAARRAAATDPEAGTDTFTITVTDGYQGGTVEAPVTVTIAPLVTEQPAPMGGGGGVAPVEPVVVEPVVVAPVEPASEPNKSRNDSDPPATPAVSIPTPRVRATSVSRPRPADAPAPLAADPTSERIQADSPEPEAGLTSRVETGTQAMTVSILFLVIGGWFFARRFTSGLQ